MTKLDIEKVKSIQLDVLDAIHRFCCDNSIRYSLACGTLLGAKRHGGYIPWDDDIDIYLLREDYNKLIRTFPETYEGLYKIASLERDEHWDRAYAKGYHCETIFKEETTSDYPLGVCIDIFPIDNIPPLEKDWLRYNRVRQFLQHVYTLKSLKFSKNRSLVKNAILLLGKILIFPLSLRRIAILISQYAQKYNDAESCRVYESIQGFLSQRPFPKHLFDSISDIAFENREYKAFTDADSYLTNTYGDWRKLPPEEERVAHHSFKAYWK